MLQTHLGDAVKLDFKPSKKVREALLLLGRTEDLKFSPDGKRLAISGYGTHKILILDIATKHGKNGTGLVANDYLEVTCSDLKLPHGICWIDDSMLAVANRGSLVCVLQLPQKKPAHRTIELTSYAVITRSDFPQLRAPGAVSVEKLGKDEYAFFVCCWPANMVSRHVLNTKNSAVFSDHSVYLKNEVLTPDCVLRSGSGRLMAVSNHRSEFVGIYENSKPLNEKSVPIAKLIGSGFPHGLQFSADETYIFVASAGRPFVYVYHNGGKGWAGEYEPVTTIRTLDDEAFKRGNVNEADGGSKGLSLSQDGTILAVTSEEAPLGFFDIQPLLKLKKFPKYVHPDFPQLPPKPPKSPWLKAWKALRRIWKSRLR